MSHREIPEPARVGEVGAPRMPQGLPEAAKAVWRSLVPELEASGLLRRVDALALEMLCVAAARARQARRELERHVRRHKSVYTTGSMGQLVEHPALGTERAYAREIARWCERFGLDAAARSRLGLAGEAGRRPEDDIAGRIGPSPRLTAIDGGRGG